MEDKEKTHKTIKELFIYVWQNRDHVSELSGKPLLNKNQFKFHFQFLHVLSKNTYPKYALKSKNILLALPDEHEKQDTYPKFKDMQLKLIQEYMKEFYSKEY
jgi:hypothetical protein